MILIVVDTGPINYLIQIGHIDLLSKILHHRLKLTPGYVVERAERLVGQQDRRIIGKNRGNGNSGTHTARQLARPSPSHRGEADACQVLAGDPQTFLLRDIANPEAESDVVLYSHPRIDGVLLEDDAPVRARTGH
jgi:predicted nucleic acid-binding protein